MSGFVKETQLMLNNENLDGLDMQDPTLFEIENALDTANGLYHRLVLLVGPAGGGKSQILGKLAKIKKTTVMNLNLELSQQLLDLTKKKRRLQVPKILEELVVQHDGTVLLDNIEILFDVELKQDPLRLLQGISRNKSIVASWNGQVENDKLVYAEAEHQEYRIYDTKELITVMVENSDN